MAKTIAARNAAVKTTKPKKAATTGEKPVATAPSVVLPNSTTSPLEQISDIHQHHLDACVELARRLLKAIPSLRKGMARPRAVLKTVIFSWPRVASRPRMTEWNKTLRLACWNADGLRGRKLELEHFLSQHDVDMSRETFLNPERAFRIANYVCHRTDRPTDGCGTAILVRRGITNHSSTVPGLTQLEVTAIQIVLAGRPVKVLAAYLSPSGRFIGSDLDACFGGGLPVLMAGYLNVKHFD